MKKSTLLGLFMLSFWSVFAQNGQQAPASIANNGKVWASLYQQRAAEYKALCFQAYNIARLRLEAALKKHHTKPYAIVTDIDETLLDNSPYTAGRAINNQDFDITTWKQWTAKGVCDTVPGAPSFLKYAASKGVAVYYITNRDENERTGTAKNLKLYHLPYVDDTHLILKMIKSSKQTRRLEVLKTHEIVLLCGDNLPDFDALYDAPSTQQSRNEVTEKLRKQFGNKYVVIPNAGYGDWESAIFNQKYTNAQKDSVIKAQVKTFQ
ncbi:MAG: 5'-nucleotidase, lipoprotein e(P4) family [Mucilaginibacter sp.]